MEKECNYCKININKQEYDQNGGLCNECLEVYDNKTGYCSLDCCMTGNCDESC